MAWTASRRVYSDRALVGRGVDDTAHACPRRPRHVRCDTARRAGQARCFRVLDSGRHNSLPQTFRKPSQSASRSRGQTCAVSESVLQRHHDHANWRWRSDTHLIGVGGGTISGVKNWNDPVSHTHFKVEWQEQTLVIETGSYTGSAPETGEWAERRELWSLDSPDRLRVAITTRSSVDVSSSAILLYRRR